MQILLGILAAVGTLAFFLIRLNQVNRAGRELVESASDVKKAVRRYRWQSKSKRKTPLTDITDARLAAAIMMCAVAKSMGDITESQRDAMLGQMRDILRMDGDEAVEMLAEARWLIAELTDLDTTLRRASKAVEASCSIAERQELLAMLETVAAVEGDVTEYQTTALDRIRRRLIPDR